METRDFPMLKRQPSAIFYGGSWHHPAQLSLLFIPIPLVSDEDDQRVGTYSYTTEVLSLDPSPYF